MASYNKKRSSEVEKEFFIYFLRFSFILWTWQYVVHIYNIAYLQAMKKWWYDGLYKEKSFFDLPQNGYSTCHVIITHNQSQWFGFSQNSKRHKYWHTTHICMHVRVYFLYKNCKVVVVHIHYFYHYFTL